MTVYDGDKQYDSKSDSFKAIKTTRSETKSAGKKILTASMDC